MADVMTSEAPKTDAGKSVAPKAAPPAARDPFSAFRAEMDHLVESFFGRERAGSLLPRFETPALFGGAISPSVDLHDEPGQATLTAELPGLKPEDVELSVRGGVLTLKGEKKQETTRGEGAGRIAERRWGAFERAFVLPEGVDEAKAEARFENGVLTVTLPKTPKAAETARRIEIR